MDFDQKIDLLVNHAHRLLGVLKDPTANGQQVMTPEQRNSARELAHDQLLTIIDGLESAAYFQSAISECSSFTAANK